MVNASLQQSSREKSRRRESQICENNIPQRAHTQKKSWNHVNTCSLYGWEADSLKAVPVL